MSEEQRLRCDGGTSREDLSNRIVKIERDSPSPVDEVADIKPWEHVDVVVKTERIEDESRPQPLKQESQSQFATVKVEPLSVPKEVDQVGMQQEGGKTAYQCGGCLRQFSGRTSLVSHQNKRGGACYEARTIYPCTKCGERFSKEAHLQTHLHTHSDGKRFLCDICKRRFRWKKYFLKHVCREQRTFKCAHCPKIFSQPSTLEAHNRTHTGDKPFQCPDCPMLFSFKANMRRHIERRHVNKINLTCEYCGKSYKQASQLKYHTRVHWADNKPFKCLHCHKSYSHKLHIERHYKKKHPGIEYIPPLTDAEIANKGWELLQKRKRTSDNSILPDVVNVAARETVEVPNEIVNIVEPEMVTVECKDSSSESSDSEASDEHFADPILPEEVDDIDATENSAVLT